VEIVTRSGNVLKIESDWDADISGGRLCEHGRFDPLEEKRERITTPLLRLRGKLEPVSWDEALQAAAELIGKTPAEGLGVLASSYSTNEALYALSALFRRELKVHNVELLNDCAPKLFDKPRGSLADIAASDVILVVGVDPVKDQPVSSFFVKHAVDKGARLIVVDGTDNGLAPFASLHLEMAEVVRAVEIAERAGSPIVLYGTGVTEDTCRALQKLHGKAAFVALEPGVNTRAAVAFGLKNGFQPPAVKALYAMLGEQTIDKENVAMNVDKNTFVIVQASFVSPLTERADQELQMPIW
jgi:formate dehydrogenase major subunit